jgi:membrane-bound metal-dependent hydrolase YbcI (DUF457 family)
VFIGHFGAGLAAKRFTPYTSLGTLVVAVQLLDLLWPTFLMLGIERVRIDPGNTAVTPLAFEYYPWTHSLAMAVVWAAVAATAYVVYRRQARSGWIIGAAVLSHWVLDFVTHRPDLPLWPTGRVVGLGLWNSVSGTVAAEGVLYMVGLWLYATHTEPADRVGRYALAAFAVGLPLIYAGNLLGPPPPSVETIAVVGQGQWLLVLWAVWVDRHRRRSGSGGVQGLRAKG